MDRQDRLILLVLSLILISPLAIPLTSSGTASGGSIEMVEKAPKNCIASPRATTTLSGNPPVMIGEVSMEKSNGTTVRIEFSKNSDRSIPDGTIQLRFGEFGNVTAAKGFAKQWDGVYNWDRSPDPWIEYSVQQTSSGPNSVDITNRSDQWGVVPLPAYGGQCRLLSSLLTKDILVLDSHT
ncbi:hypothetical protein [Haloferax massiliensis]|uniref:hypothetical protein n=1 Tax=Haloferax massiliensis TaxID=1476858 RepID=UPI00111244F6|nr:hypothetical protein [Haloferax massiliensis]